MSRHRAKMGSCQKKRRAVKLGGGGNKAIQFADGPASPIQRPLQPHGFLAHRHQRSNVETTFHMVKFKFGDYVCRKKRVA